MSLCINLFVIGPSCGFGTSDIYDRQACNSYAGLWCVDHTATVTNFFHEPGLLDCFAGYGWSSNIFLYQALFGLWL
jgi:hypothetical protein